MDNNIMKNRWRVAAVLSGLAFFIGLVGLVGLSAGTGVYLVNHFSQNRDLENYLPIELNAGTSARTESMSMATGLVDGNVEGLFVLDHASGNLQCWVLNPRTGQVGGIYRANVTADLMNVGKTEQPDYIMTTGNFFFSGNNTGSTSPGQSICYIADGKTGNVVGYGLVYNKQAIKRGIVQNGLLKIVCKGSGRTPVAAAGQ